MGATCGTGTAYHSGTPVLILWFTVQCFVDYCTDCFFGVFKLFLENTIQLIYSLNK